ncbi:MAG: hypothetical protein Q4G40_06630 [Brachybacterium sp.]|nr:hypothetical protein [Brachybacterium sp.]
MPESSLVIGLIGTESGLPGSVDHQVAIGSGEAITDIRVSAFSGPFHRDLTTLDRAVIGSGEELIEQVGVLADNGATVAVVNCEDGHLLQAMPAFAEAGICVISPTSTAMDLRAEDLDTRGLLVRLAPDDDLLARYLAEQAMDAGGQDTQPGSCALLARDTVQGRSLAARLRYHLDPAGGTLETHLYEPNGSDHDGIVADVLAQQPGLVFLAGGDETPGILQRIADEARGESGRIEHEMSLRLGFHASRPLRDAEVSYEALEAVTGMLPGAPLATAHVNQLLNADPNLWGSGFAFAQQGYDAIVLAALAAHVARSTEGTRIAGAIGQVLAGDSDCTSYDACRQQLDVDQAEDTAWLGFSGPLGIGPDGDPSRCSLAEFGYTGDRLIGEQTDTVLEREG